MPQGEGSHFTTNTAAWPRRHWEMSMAHVGHKVAEVKGFGVLKPGPFCLLLLHVLSFLSSDQQQQQIIVEVVLEIINFEEMNRVYWFVGTGDSMPRESICGDGPGVGLVVRRCPWWSDIMRDTKVRVDARG
uniref:Uncharacterized protein n=1 Tax=Oryza sativa subsp. japonica TaxID=39947 RepID=Q2QMZ6_ORYSJ|nr:hypothetical protein LOC_Os12g39490 [Oryza sativa Japonica Group]